MCSSAERCTAVQNGAQQCRTVQMLCEWSVCHCVRRCGKTLLFRYCSHLVQASAVSLCLAVTTSFTTNATGCCLLSVYYQSVCPLVRHSAPVGEWSIAISLCVCVCVSVGPRAYLLNCSTDLHEIFYADPLWPWLGPPLAALRYRGRVWYLVVSVITTPLSVSEKIQVGLSTDETSVY